MKVHDVLLLFAGAAGAFLLMGLAVAAKSCANVFLRSNADKTEKG